jgi:hypothetical protein
MPNPTSVAFLHIPKTAGQSIHARLVDLFGAAAVAPARVNEQLILMSIADIRRYRVFSGHLDWASLDCMSQPSFTFTVLRNPLDRILSFYFFLRREARALSAAELVLPQNQGKHAALTYSCDDYFTAGPPPIRTFLDNHFDNFYMYYFAGRRFDGRQSLIGRQRADATVTEDRILDLARRNIAVLDRVYTVDNLADLEDDLCRISGSTVTGKPLASLRINAGDNDSTEVRKAKLSEMGATNKTFARLEQMTRLDQVLWNEQCRRLAARSSKAVT